MPVIYTCSAAQHAQVGVTVFRLGELVLSLRRELIKAIYTEWDGANFGPHSITVAVDGDEAKTRIRQFNKANCALAGQSVEERVTNYFVGRGMLPTGAQSGAPE